ncbi:helix-turn-helix domain-containing protein [Stenotrophomonas indicatrix]|uniref:Helix-turn-helix transcriptional regulator n=1 Tax=Stenotrophomonas indicatrix TaxID=2045451 RepID=A0ABT8Q7M3_9GAMM|nr:helix-turn-helix transcriptional regulator [Stenotrophomonas indicatrix]MDN8660682.1 helix-turn-helix transcriptional regulator [Stenotrophomonas indicatrix]MDN8667835.1 helix-turn-helix transcriptional regulator [Stenotrophomonas indicatrix]
MQEENLALKLGAAIRTSRLATGSSQERFADAISMHRAYYSAIERGEKNITIGTLVRLANGLGIKPSELLAAAGL